MRRRGDHVARMATQQGYSHEQRENEADRPAAGPIQTGVLRDSTRWTEAVPRARPPFAGGADSALEIE